MHDFKNNKMKVHTVYCVLVLHVMPLSLFSCTRTCIIVVLCTLLQEVWECQLEHEHVKLEPNNRKVCLELQEKVATAAQS